MSARTITILVILLVLLLVAGGPIGQMLMSIGTAVHGFGHGIFTTFSGLKV